MNIIVTGGAGFVGSNFVFHMLKKYPDYRIICLDKLTYAGNLSTLAPVMDNPNFRFVKADICDRETVDKLFEEEHPDIVVNFAAESHVDRSIEDPGIFLQTNIIGTSVLMDACRKYGIQRYHQVSTDEVYGDLPLDRPDLFFTEETPIHTSSPYSSSKAAADLLVLAYHRTYGLPVTISRCSNNYGPYHFPEKLIPLVIARVTICVMLSTRPRFTMSWAGCRRQSSRMVSRKLSSGISITVSGGRPSSAVSIRTTMRKCTATANRRKEHEVFCNRRWRSAGT